MRKVMVVVPAHNEAGNIAEMVARCKPYGDVIVADDGSTDDTARIAAIAGAKIVPNRIGSQHGDGIRAGLREAIALGADVIVTINAGFTHRPEDIPALISPLTTGLFDVSIGSKILSGSLRKQSLLRHFLTTCSTHLLGWLTVGNPLDYSSFRGYTRWAARMAVLNMDCMDMRTYVFNPCLTYRLWTLGMRMVQVPISYTSVNSTLNMSQILAVLRGLWIERKTQRIREELCRK